MYRKSFLNFITTIAVITLIFSQYGAAQAAKIDFGGEPEDNFWNIDTTYCKDGFSITATHILLGNDGKSFWLELGSSTIPVTVQTEVDIREPVDPPQPPALARIAHGDGTSLINGGQPFTVNFFFTSLQNVGTPITISIERWDHGNMTWREVNEDGSDESPTDDIKTDTQVLGNCLIDTGVQSVSTVVNPATVQVGESTTVSVNLNAIPAAGYTSTEFTCTFDATFVEISDIVTTNQFDTDAVVAIKGPQNGSFIVAIAGSNGRKATTSGPAFTFHAKSLQVGQTTLDCTARFSKGDNLLTPLPSSAAVLTIATFASLNGQALASKPIMISIYHTDLTLATSVLANEEGMFSLSIPSGAYKVVASAHGFLGAQASITLAGGSTTTLPTITLLAGDIDGNNVIDQFDAMTIGINYNTDTPGAADLNNDGIINVLDLELLASNYQKTGPLMWQDDGTGNEPPGPSFAMDVKPIFQAKCSGCHGSSGGWDASSYQTVISTGEHHDQEPFTIVPGDATNSLLVQMISRNPGVTPMPPSGSLSASEVNIITDWINAGAQDN